MKFLIAGFGSIGRRHMRNLLALGERDIVLLRSNRSTLPLDEIADFPVETDLRAALHHRPDAVIISNPTALHLDVAIPAAEAGCDLLIEKPISHSLERVDELQAAAQRSGARILVGFHYRFHPGLKKARQLILEGAFGRVHSVRAHRGEYLPNWHPYENFRESYASRPDLGGGVILTLCHPLDYLRWMLGEISALWAFTSASPELNLSVEDCAEIGLRFQSGITGSVHLDYLQRPGAHTLEIICSQAVLRWTNADGSLSIHHPTNSYSSPSPLPPAGEGVRVSPPIETYLPDQATEGIPFERNWLFLEEMRHFLSVTRGESEPSCTLQDGTRALQIALAALQSGLDGKIKRLD